jgi:hypothetical protein
MMNADFVALAAFGNCRTFGPVWSDCSDLWEVDLTVRRTIRFARGSSYKTLTRRAPGRPLVELARSET